MTSTNKNKCSLVESLRDQVPLLMKLFRNYISEYNLDNETKCLHTAVLVMALFFGQDAVKNTRICDTHHIKPKYNELIEAARKRNVNSHFNPSLINISECSRMLFDKRSYTNNLFYIMVADCYLDNKLLFPGHVFVVEKNGRDEYYLYQSYINQYTLKQFHESNGNTFRVSRDKLYKFITEMTRLFEKTSVWTKETTTIWRDFTLASHPEFEGQAFYGKSQFCFQRLPITQCKQNLSKIVNLEIAKHNHEATTYSPLIQVLLKN